MIPILNYFVSAACVALSLRAGHLVGILIGTALLFCVAPRLQWIACGLLPLCMLFVVIHLLTFAAVPAEYDQFPKNCSRPLGCTRVTEKNPHRAKNMTVLDLPMSLEHTTAAVKEWAKKQPRTNLMRDESVTAKSRYLFFTAQSFFFGFPDAVAVLLSEDPKNPKYTTVQAQSELRIGKSDFNVNLRRVQNLWSFLKDYKPSK